MEDQRLIAFKRLLDIMDELRQKCPWDSTQTIDSLRYLTIEETYELSDAIIEKDYNDLKKELGDLLLHIVFYSKIASEGQYFDITDVANGICEKLILRHPHIFGNEHAATAEDVRNNWEKIKLKKEGNRSVLGGVPSALPAMVKAYRIQEKARGVGFDWNNIRAPGEPGTLRCPRLPGDSVWPTAVWVCIRSPPWGTSRTFLPLLISTVTFPEGVSLALIMRSSATRSSVTTTITRTEVIMVDVIFFPPC